MCVDEKRGKSTSLSQLDQNRIRIFVLFFRGRERRGGDGRWYTFFSFLNGNNLMDCTGNELLVFFFQVCVCECMFISMYIYSFLLSHFPCKPLRLREFGLRSGWTRRRCSCPRGRITWRCCDRRRRGGWWRRHNHHWPVKSTGWRSQIKLSTNDRDGSRLQQGSNLLVERANKKENKKVQILWFDYLVERRIG